MNNDDIYLSLALAPGGAKVALGMRNCTIDLLDWPGGEGIRLRPTLPGTEAEAQRVHALAFSPDGRYLAAGVGLSAIELQLLADWLEAPQFPSGMSSLLPAPEILRKGRGLHPSSPVPAPGDTHN